MKYHATRLSIALLTFSLFAVISPLPASAQAPTGAGVSAAPPSGALPFFRQIDQCLNKVDKMLSGEGTQFDKGYRSKEAVARLGSRGFNLHRRPPGEEGGRAPVTGLPAAEVTVRDIDPSTGEVIGEPRANQHYNGRPEPA